MDKRERLINFLQASGDLGDDIEDVYLAEKRLEDIHAGRTQTISLQEIMKRYGIDKGDSCN